MRDAVHELLKDGFCGLFARRFEHLFDRGEFQARPSKGFPFGHFNFIQLLPVGKGEVVELPVIADNCSTAAASG